MSEQLGTGQSNTNGNSKKNLQTSRLNKPWKLSNEGITFIAVWESGIYNGKNWQKQTVTEGMILTVYDDGRGFPTVGMGHLVVSADNLKLGNTITMERAREFARKDLSTVENAINSKVKVPLFQYEYDALVSLLFNTGIYRNKKKNETINRIDVVANILNKGGYADMPEFIKQFIASVPTRRKSEANLFKNGVYDAKH